MKSHLQVSHLTVVSADAEARRDERPSADGDFGEFFLPAVILLVIALVRLAAFAWHPVAWGVEESIALAFALGAGYLMSQYLLKGKGGSPD